MTEIGSSPLSSSATAGFARWRKPCSRLLAVAFLALLIFTSSPHSPFLDLAIEIIGILLIIAAVLGRIWCALYIAGRKNAELCADGPYSICRNPLYLFSFLGTVGITFLAGSAPLALALVPIFWGYHHFVIRAEETNLRSLFGSAYADYCAKVPRILPNPDLYWSRSQLSIAPPRHFARFVRSGLVSCGAGRFRDNRTPSRRIPRRSFAAHAFYLAFLTDTSRTASFNIPKTSS